MVYLPAHFEVTDKTLMHDLIRAVPLGMLVTVGSEGITANHVPFLLEPGDAQQETPDRLIGHVARNNAVWHDFDAGLGALVVFQSIDAYITPTWYETKRTTHEVVPTWNYAVVHVAGPLVIHDDVKWIRGQAGKLTRMMEANRDDPWKMADAPREYTEQMLQSIVGIEIPVRTMTGKFKASQNRPDADAEGAAAGLRESGDLADTLMAELIERSRGR
ncbi:MAG: FMN-binding negative transcriptional regulator [Thermomicrobiales bacterium]|nr:FMN-binding negative transcriptional regulator [Thermomicrobiales bacterium]